MFVSHKDIHRIEAQEFSSTLLAYVTVVQHCGGLPVDSVSGIQDFLLYSTLIPQAPKHPRARTEGMGVHHGNHGVQANPREQRVARSLRLSEELPDVVRLRHPRVLEDDPEQGHAATHRQTAKIRCIAGSVYLAAGLLILEPNGKSPILYSN